MDDFEQEISQDAIPQNASEAEALIKSWESPSQSTEQAPKDAAPPTQEFAINYKGKEEKYPLNKLIEFAQQGRDYAQKMREYHLQRTTWEQDRQKELAERQAVQERLQRYAEIEAYNQKDPSWWEHVQRSYQERKAEQGQSGSPRSLPPEVEAKLGKVDQFFDALSVQARAKEDADLDLAISDYRKEFADFDWAAKDENGLDLERRILAHAEKLGFSKPEHFRVAANDYLFKQHLDRARITAKGEVGKQIQKTTKLGLGPVTNQPAGSRKAVKNLTSRSYDEILNQALEDEGLV